MGDIQKRLEVLDNRARLQPIELKDARASPHSFEKLWRAILLRLKEKTTLEAAFLVQFFGTEVDVEIMFKKIFEKTLNDIINSLTNHISNSFDMVATLLSLLLMVTLTLTPTPTLTCPGCCGCRDLVVCAARCVRVR